MIKCWCLLIVVSFLYIHSSEGFGSKFWKLRELLTKDSELQNESVFHAGSEQYIEQQLDHFNPMDKAVYKQRYFVNDEYFNKSDGPVFLFIGGESPVSMGRVLQGFHVKAAKKFGALIFAVEHRFYGQSMNDDGLKLENLKYLSSQQALADLAHFHKVMSETYNLGKNNKWICFGGSYPGSLSAWFRLKYPHLVVGAVSSSSPVQALVDFQDYNNVVTTSLGTEIVGGSKQCVDNIRTAFMKVDEMMDREEFAKLGEDFKFCSPMTLNVFDMYVFASGAADLFMGTVQYNNIPGRASFNVEKICDTMTSKGDHYQNLVTIYRTFLDLIGESCTDNSWSNYIKSLRNDTVVKPVHNGIERQWVYQTCAQFGYYQACEDNTECIFSKYLSLAPNLEICRSVYGIDPFDVYNNVEFTNSFYGSNEPQGSNILFVNGLIDPWHALSVLKNLSSTENAIVIPGTAHCADMHTDSEDDPSVLKEARETIMSKLESWLGLKTHKPKVIKLTKPLGFRFLASKRHNGARL